MTPDGEDAFGLDGEFLLAASKGGGGFDFDGESLLLPVLEEFDLGGSFFSVFEGEESGLEGLLSMLDGGSLLHSGFDLDGKSFFLSVVVERGFCLDGEHFLLSVVVEDLDEVSFLPSVFEGGGFG